MFGVLFLDDPSCFCEALLSLMGYSFSLAANCSFMFTSSSLHLSSGSEAKELPAKCEKSIDTSCESEQKQERSQEEITAW